MKFIPLPKYAGSPRHISEFTNAEEALAHAEAIHAEHVKAHEEYPVILEHNKIVLDYYNDILAKAGFSTPVAAPCEFISTDFYPVLLAGYNQWKKDCENFEATLQQCRENSEFIQRMTKNK